LRGDVPAGAFPFLASGMFEQPARRGQESAGRRTAQRAIPTTARRRKRPPGRARSPAMSQLVAVRKHRPMAVWGGRIIFDKIEEPSEETTWIKNYLNPMDTETNGSFGS